MFYIYDTLRGYGCQFCTKEDAYKHWFHSSVSKPYEYYIYNGNMGLYIPLQNKDEVRYLWKNWGYDHIHNQVVYDDLNVTGKDKHNVYYDGYIEQTYRFLKVFDKYGRSIDIREDDWDIEHYEMPVWKHNWYYNNGSKHNWRRAHGPSMYRNSLKNNDILLDIDGKAGGKTYHDISRNRISKEDCWDYIEEQWCKRYIKSKSWKDQTKVAHQWMKHKNIHGGRIKVIPVDATLVYRLADEIVGK